ncbi:MAG TPA: cobalamin synthase [Desulfovibrio sp.]|nr:cobalamin synthase [Desulfovibrio sp.]
MQNLTSLEKIKTEELDAGTVFSGTPSGKKILGFTAPCIHTPAINPDYIYHEAMREIIVWLMNPSDPLYIFGPCGSGKTSLIKQLSAKLNYPVFEVTGHSRLEFTDMAGHLSLDQGSMTFQYGPLALAMKYGGMFLLNELDLLDPSTAAGLNSILDGSPLCIPENGGEVIQPHPMFRFAATANTNGGFDESVLYQGTLKQNIAFMDRFWLCEISYPETKAEAALLAKITPTLPEKLRTTMVDYVNEVRKLFVGEADTGDQNSIEITFSTRTLIRWADLTLRFQPLSQQGIKPITHALDRAIGFRATPETRAMLHELAQRMFTLSEEQPE